MDGKCDQFHKYLHSTGAMKALIDALASLFRLESWPANPVDFICQHLSFEQNVTTASLTNELEELRIIVPEEELKEDMYDEIRELIGEMNENSVEHEADTILMPKSNDDNQDSKESDQETIQLSQEDNESDQISKEINGPNSNESKQEVEVEESGTQVKKQITGQRNKSRKKRKNKKQNA